MQYEDFARTPEADLLTRICLSVLQINGQLQGVGDRLGADLGLPSSRFQVLGPISLSDTGLTVPQIARRMGLSRQTVHATVDRLAADGVVE